MEQKIRCGYMAMILLVFPCLPFFSHFCQLVLLLWMLRLVRVKPLNSPPSSNAGVI